MSATQVPFALPVRLDDTGEFLKIIDSNETVLGVFFKCHLQQAELFVQAANNHAALGEALEKQTARLEFLARHVGVIRENMNKSFSLETLHDNDDIVWHTGETEGNRLERFASVIDSGMEAALAIARKSGEGK